MTHRLPSPLLVVEASGAAGSVALIIDDAVVGKLSVLMGPSRDDTLLPAISALLSEAKISPREIRAVACGSGPGSFTSLRIAASLAKGIVVANDVALFAIPSVLLAAAALKTEPGRYILHSDALRSERYVVRIRVGVNGELEMSGITRMTLADVAIAAELEQVSLVTVGPVMPGTIDSKTVQPLAQNALLLSDMWSAFGPVSVASWEPDYGRLAEAQVKWESTHGRMLPVS